MNNKFIIIITSVIFLSLSSCFDKEQVPGQSDSASKQPVLPINHPPINPDTTTNLNNLSNSSQLLGSRFYMRSFLKEIFYNTSSASALEIILDKYLGAETEDGSSNQANFANMILFGGPCDYYSEAGTTKACNNLDANLTIPVNSPSTISREAERVKICVELTNNNTILSAGLSNINLTTSSALNTTNIESAFELFYPGYTLDTDSQTGFTSLVNSMQSNSETTQNQWRMIFFTLCRTPDWQAL